MSQRPALHLLTNNPVEGFAPEGEDPEFVACVQRHLEFGGSQISLEVAFTKMPRLIEALRKEFLRKREEIEQAEVQSEEDRLLKLLNAGANEPVVVETRLSQVETSLEPVAVSAPVVPESMPAVEEIETPTGPTGAEIDHAVGYFRDLPEQMIRHESAVDMLLVLWLWICLKLSSIEDKQSDLAQQAKRFKRWTGQCLNEVFGLSWDVIEARRYFTEPEFALARSLVSGTHFEEFLAGVRFFDAPAEKKLIEWKNGECQFPLVPREVWYAEENQGKFYLIVLKWLLFRSLMNVRNEGLLQGEELRTCERRIKSRLTQVVDVLKAYFGYTDESLKGVAVSDREIWFEVRDTIVTHDDELTLWLENLDWSNDLPLPKYSFVDPQVVPSAPRKLPPPGGAFGGGTSTTRHKKSRADADRELRNAMKGSSNGGGGQKKNKGGKPGKK